MSGLVRWLYRLARLGRDVEVLSSGDPAKIGRRLVNKRIGRILGQRLWLARQKEGNADGRS